MQNPGKALTSQDQCRVSVPARTSISVLDMNDFQLGKAGGGNVGFAFSAFTEISVEFSSEDQVLLRAAVWEDDRRVIVTHILEEWRRQTGFRASYRVSVLATNSPHTGFASSGAIQTAIWCGLNYLSGGVFTEGELRGIIASSYREAGKGALVRGFTTGLSSFLGMHGGFAVVDRELRPTFHSLLPDWSAAVVVPRGVETVSFGEIELRTLTELGPLLDRKHGMNKRSVIDSLLLPAIEARSLPDIGQAIASLQSIGSKVAEISIYGDLISSALKDLRRVVPCAFMSAVGPGIAVITDRPCSEFSSILHGIDVDAIWMGCIDNIGLRARFTPGENT
jgi:beta-ribofuranosylaminobenzene 5'-phosphate synthase